MKHFLLAFSTLISISAFAQFGTLDGDFDADGVLFIDVAGDSDLGRTVVQDENGKILVSGYGLNGNNNFDWFIKRMFPDGSADNTFGTNGMLTIDLNSGNDQCLDMVLQDDGKILLAGMTTGRTSADFTVVRLEANGTIDGSFGTAGFAIVEVSPAYDVLQSIALQPDGKILGVGHTTDGPDVDIALIRLNPNGSLDNSFSFDGMLITSVNEDDWGQDIQITSNGKIVIAGSTEHGIGETNTLLVRYNEDGSLDNSFGINGKVETDLSVSVDEFYALTINGAGKILATGGSWNGSSTDMLVVRFNADGTLDNTFSFDGVVETDFAGNTDKGWDILVQPDSRILVVGGMFDGSDKLALARYKWDGTLDNTFGTNGRVTTQVGTADVAYSVSLQSDGKILSAGFSLNGGYDAFAVRYLSGMNVGIGEVDAYIGSTLIYPNPVVDHQITIEYELKAADRIAIELFDVNGKRLAQLQPSTSQVAGAYNKTLALPSLSPGNYFLKLNAEKGAVTVRLTLN